MSGVPVCLDFHDGAEPRREQLLAMRRLRGNLECLPPDRTASRVHMVMVSHMSKITRELEELIAALDRRVPRVERAGEADIARDAAGLRAKAVRRLAELTGKRDSGTSLVATKE